MFRFVIRTIRDAKRKGSPVGLENRPGCLVMIEIRVILPLG